MALDFPSSPSLNDTYQLGNKTWKWNGSAWQLIGEFIDVAGVYDHANGAFDLANGTATIANTDVTQVSISAGSYGNSTAIPSLTLAANGRVTAITTASISVPTGDIVDDTTPQLGGNLDLNGNDITGTGNIDITGNFTLAGNLTVSGETTYANTTTVNLGDSIITLNADIPQASAPTENSGIEIDRGSSANVSLLWNETDDSWTFTNDGSTYYSIPTNTSVSTAQTTADGAYSHANGAFTAANTSQTHAEAAFTQANTNATSITTTNSRLDSAFGHANAAFDTANTANTTDYTNVSVSAGTYGNTTAIPSLTLAANGRVTAISTNSISTDLVSDTTPQLGGNLDLNGSDITGTGDIDITGDITATGNISGGNVISVLEVQAASLNVSTDITASGTITLNSLIYPSVDGSANQVIVTDGSGGLSFANQTASAANATVDVFTTTANGATASFDLGFSPSGNLAILASVDGVTQASSTNYSISGSTITFTSTPASGAVIYVTGFTNVTPIGPASVTVTSFATTSNGSVTSFDLGFTALNEQSLIVSLDGVLQQPNSAYTVSGNTITFSSAPANTVNVVATSLYTNVATYSAESTASIYTHANAAYDQANTATITASDYSSDFFTANGTGSTFTVTTGHNANSAFVYMNGIMLVPAVDYDISGTTLTTTFVPDANNQILVRYLPI